MSQRYNPRIPSNYNGRPNIQAASPESTNSATNGTKPTQMDKLERLLDMLVEAVTQLNATDIQDWESQASRQVTKVLVNFLRHFCPGYV